MDFIWNLTGLDLKGQAEWHTDSWLEEALNMHEKQKVWFVGLQEKPGEVLSSTKGRLHMDKNLPVSSSLD